MSNDKYSVFKQYYYKYKALKYYLKNNNNYIQIKGGGYEDLSERFDNSVSKAVTYYTENPFENKQVIIQSASKGRPFINIPKISFIHDNNIKDDNTFTDKSGIFSYSVSNAIKYYEENYDKLEKVKIYSESKQEWYKIHIEPNFVLYSGCYTFMPPDPSWR